MGGRTLTSEAMTSAAPDVLVLGGGGILGEVWMNAVLAGMAESGFDARRSGAFVGTSAGSIVATALAAGVRPAARLGRLPEQPPVEAATAASSATRRLLGAAAGLGSLAAAPVATLALSSAAPGGALVRRAALSRVPQGRMSLGHLGREVERLGVRWDGRLLVSAVELETGRRVMFGAPGAPEASVGQAVMASCAIPGVFRPLLLDGRSYVDGGAWSPTNMDAAEVGRGDRVLCLNPTGSLRPTIAAPAGALGPVSRSVAGAEALVLRRRGATVETVNPDRASVEALGPNLMDPGPRAAVIAAGLAQGRRLAARAAAAA
jgi:NTE family protein